MDLKSYTKIYFVGIGGIGMSALARWFYAHDYKVAGYDRTATALTSQLKEEGIDVHFEDDIKNIPSDFNSSDTLVVYTPAVPENCKELNYFKTNGNTIIKRAAVLGIITENTYTIAVAGTHGKTTTSSMIAHVLKSCGKNVSAFLGGITQNYNTNLLLGDKSLGTPIVVVEADEYDRSFLKLRPDISVVTTMDPDHLDIYENADDFHQTFYEFASKTDLKGTIIYRNDLPIAHQKFSVLGQSFGLSSADFIAQNIRVENGKFVFEVIEKGNNHTSQTVELALPGLHNVLNAIAAFAVGKFLGIDTFKLAHAISTFKGVKRRFEYIIKTEKVVYIDDYAHHPTEIEAFATALKTLYPSKKITMVFQPHLYSRTRDFMQGFASSLSLVDEVILLDIYPARETQIEGISSSELLKLISCPHKHLVSKENLIDYLSSRPIEVIATVGAGDVDKFVPLVEKMLVKKYEI